MYVCIFVYIIYMYLYNMYTPPSASGMMGVSANGFSSFLHSRALAEGPGAESGSLAPVIMIGRSLLVLHRLADRKVAASVRTGVSELFERQAISITFLGSDLN